MINIKCGDFFELIQHVPNNSIDLIVCDGPYGITTNIWDNIKSITDFNLHLIQLFSSKLITGGSLYLFGKDNCVDFIDYRPYLKLNRRIIWYQPARLSQGKSNFTNNYDVIYYFSKGNPKIFNLDDIRVSQLTELEHRLRVERVPSVQSGRYKKTKYNPVGKNPGDVWGDIKQLTYKSKELLDRSYLNTIQKPEKLIERIILASSNQNDVVLDPFAGTGTTLSVCKKLNRHCIGFEIDPRLVEVINRRLIQGQSK